MAETAVEPALLDALCEHIQNSPEQEAALLNELIARARSQELELQCAVFDRMAWRIPIRTANPFRVMLDTYTMQRRFDLARSMAVFSMQIDADPRTQAFILMKLFHLFVQMGQPREALAAFFRHNEAFPEAAPVTSAAHLARLAWQAKLKLPAKFVITNDEPPPADSATMRVQEPSIARAYPCPVYGTEEPPPFLQQVTRDNPRPPVDVVRIDNGRLLILDGEVCVVDATGRPCMTLSFAEFPGLMQERLAACAAQGEGERKVELIETDSAVLIADRFITPNLCHMLLDHVSRLWLFEQAGVDLSQALVVGAPWRERFQTEIRAHLGLDAYLDVDRRAEIRARTLYISSNCKQHFVHPAHRGAGWVIDYLRRRFRPEIEGDVRKLFISRRNAKGRRVVNEPELEVLLRSHGFVTLRPEEMAFSDQVRAFSGATHIVSPHGAGLTNAVFARPGAHVLEMFHPIYGTPGYAALAREAGWRYAALFGRDWDSEAPEFNDWRIGDRDTFGDRNFRVDLGLVERWLEGTEPESDA